MLEDLTPQTTRPNCKIRTIFGELDDADKQRLIGFLEDSDTWSANGLAKALGAKNVKVGANTIQKHRHGSCSC
jgi:hypothetical protein